jgi:hypothetical protein
LFLANAGGGNPNVDTYSQLRGAAGSHTHPVGDDAHALEKVNDPNDLHQI